MRRPELNEHCPNFASGLTMRRLPNDVREKSPLPSAGINLDSIRDAVGARVSAEQTSSILRVHGGWFDQIL